MNARGALPSFIPLPSLCFERAPGPPRAAVVGSHYQGHRYSSKVETENAKKQAVFCKD